MRVKVTVFIILIFLSFSTLAGQIIETTTEDFQQGETSNVEIIQEGDGALRLVNNPVIKVLQVYPNGHSTTVFRDAIFAYQGAGNPPLNFDIYLLPVSQYNTAQSVSDVFDVVNADTGQHVNMSIDQFDVIFFGCADCYGGWDLSQSSAQVTREFAHLGKGVIFSHDTIVRGCGNNHPNFASLTDVHGLQLRVGSSYPRYTRVKRINMANDPILQTPFQIPNSFTTLLCHWSGQQVVNGIMWYVGTDENGNANYDMYWHTYHNTTYNYYSAYFSFGHTEAVPQEWEAKAMINCMYHSYQGGGGQGYYLSRIYNVGSYAHFTTISWNASTPGQSSLTVQVRTGNSPSELSSWVNAQNNSDLNLTGNYLQFRVQMTSQNLQDLPILYDITINYIFPPVPSLNFYSIFILLMILSLLIIKLKTN